MSAARSSLPRRIVALTVVLAGSVAVPAASAQADGWTPPPPPDGAFTDLGAPLKSLTISRGVIGPDHTGRLMAYAVPLGDNAQLNVVDVQSRTLVRTVTLPGAGGAHAIAVAPDATVYAGSFYNGHLYRYFPETGTVEDLGAPVPGDTYLFGVNVAGDGTVYGGTYPNAHAFAYRPGVGFTDYGRMDPTLQYANYTAYDPDHHALYVGMSTKPLIKRLDLTTREILDVTPPGLPGTGVSDMNYVDGRVFANVGNTLVVLDAETNQRIDVVDAATGQVTTNYTVAARGVSPARQGGVYFTTTNLYLARYDLATNTVSTTMPNGKQYRSTRGATIGYGWGVEDGHDVLYALAGNYSGGGYRYDIDSGLAGSLQFPFEYVPSALQHVSTRPGDPKVYVNAFLNGQLGVFDPATRVTTQPVRTGQVEGWTWSDGKLYAGVYPDGKLIVWDPAVPPAAGTNPKELLSLKASYQQIRPMAVVVTEDRVLLGSAPDYGLYGGALTVYDKATGAFQVHRNVVQDQTVAALAVIGSTVYGGTSTEGGTGTDPAPGDGKLFTWDLATGAKTGELTPVPGARSVNELVVGPNGDLWGLADGNVFQFDPTSNKVVRVIRVHDRPVSANSGELAWHRNGYLYGVSNHQFFVVDPLAGTAAVIRSRIHRLTIADSGTIYLLFQPEGQINYSNVASFVPTAGACGTPDIRPTVYIGGIDSKVANRFVRDGCTLNDLAPQRGSLSKDEFMDLVAEWTSRLKRDGVVTQDEAQALLLTAAWAP